jgi:hypothetical protein
MWYAQPGWKLVYTIVPETNVSAVIVQVNGVESIPPESANRGKSWLWVQGETTTRNLDDVITLAEALGVAVVVLSDLTGESSPTSVTTLPSLLVTVLLTSNCCVLSGTQALV